MASVIGAPSQTASSANGRFAFATLGIATVFAAMLANTLVYLVGHATVGYDRDFLVLSTIWGTYVYTAFFSIAAVLVYAGLIRFTANPARIFTILAAVLLPLSVIPDLTYIPTVEGSSNAQIAVLIVMHIVAAVVITGMLRRYRRPVGR